MKFLLHKLSDNMVPIAIELTVCMIRTHEQNQWNWSLELKLALEHLISVTETILILSRIRHEPALPIRAIAGLDTTMYL